MSKIASLFLLILLLSHAASGQTNENKFESTIGYGYYQGFNIGLNYFYTEKLKAGLGIGSYLGLPPFDNENHFNIQLENTLYFGFRNIQDVGEWYFNQQIMYWEQGKDDRWKIMSLGLNIGKTIAITKRLGLDLELGPAFNLVVDVEREPGSEKSGWIFPVMGNGRAQLTYNWHL